MDININKILEIYSERKEKLNPKPKKMLYVA
jgi:hypothetical protein